MANSSRPLLPDASLAPEARTEIAQFHRAIVEEAQNAVSEHAVVVIGMRQNPVVKRARKALDEAQVNFHYLEYGSYVSGWKQRLAIKLWSGWPTFPQIFVSGRLIGGCDQLVAAIQRGDLQGL